MWEGRTLKGSQEEAGAAAAWICTNGCVWCWLLLRAGALWPQRVTVRTGTIKEKWGLLRKLEVKASWVSGNAIMNM